MTRCGAGIALPGDAAADRMHTAAEQVPSVPSYRQAARERAAALAGVDGAANAADEVERVLTAARSTQRMFA